MKCGLRPTKIEFANSSCKSAQKGCSDTQNLLAREKSDETDVERGTLNSWVKARRGTLLGEAGAFNLSEEPPVVRVKEEIYEKAPFLTHSCILA